MLSWRTVFRSRKNFFGISPSHKMALKQDKDNVSANMPAASDVLLGQQANNGHKLSKALC